MYSSFLRRSEAGQLFKAIRPQSALPVDRQGTNWPCMGDPARQLRGETNSWAEYFRLGIGRGLDALHRSGWTKLVEG